MDTAVYHAGPRDPRAILRPMCPAIARLSQLRRSDHNNQHPQSSFRPMGMVGQSLRSPPTTTHFACTPNTGRWLAGGYGQLSSICLKCMGLRSDSRAAPVPISPPPASFSAASIRPSHSAISSHGCRCSPFECPVSASSHRSLGCGDGRLFTIPR